MAPSTSGAAQWAINRRGDVVRLGCVGRVGPTSPLTGATWLLNRPRPVGVPLARLCIEGHEFRSGHHQRTKRQIPALATLARHREPVPVPFTNFSENEHLPDGTRPPVWFALDETRSLAFFAGIWTRWTWVRKVKEGETTKRPLRVSDDRCKPGGRAPCRCFMCGWEKAPQKAGPQYLLHKGVPAKGSPS